VSVVKLQHIHVIIMCKAPVAGQVKTRLMCRYSAEEAASLHRAMAERVIARAKRLFTHVIIAADDPAHPFFAAFGLPLRAQGEGDLGVRMQRQIDAPFAAGAKGVLLLGTDSPHMADARLIEAAAALDAADVVLGPVEDGGYDLIALAAAHNIFDGVAWSSADVLRRSVANAERQGLRVALLSESFDVDTPADLDRARDCISMRES